VLFDGLSAARMSDTSACGIPDRFHQWPECRDAGQYRRAWQYDHCGVRHRDHRQ
jgi:hypothetical protein